MSDVPVDQWFANVHNAIVAVVTSVTDLVEVVDSEKERFDKMPAAYVCPVVVDVQTITFQRSAFFPGFDIGICVQDDDKKTGIAKVWALGMKVVQALINDRGLSHLVDDTNAVVVPYWRKLGLADDEHWVGVKVKLTRWYL